MTVKYTTILTYRGDKSLQSIKEKKSMVYNYKDYFINFNNL